MARAAQSTVFQANRRKDVDLERSVANPSPAIPANARDRSADVPNAESTGVSQEM